MDNDFKSASPRGKWMALTAALLGWMFDGFEMGLFPQVARPCLLNLLGETSNVGHWIGVVTASFLVGAATGGVLFGWLGDRLGRVRAMTLSVLTYAVFSGLCGVAQEAWQVAVLRFVAALGMGGEWSLGVALVMEIWPNRSRAFLAGLIGAAANVGYLLVGVLTLVLGRLLHLLPDWLAPLGLPEKWIDALVSHQGWRLLMLLGAVPALLTFFIRLFVPESAKWTEERQRGTTSQWASQDLLGVAIGAICALGIVALWAVDFVPLAVQAAGTLVGLAGVTAGFLYPAWKFIDREAAAGRSDATSRRSTIGNMLMGACLSGVALLGTWASIQWAPAWADKLANPKPASVAVATPGRETQTSAPLAPAGDPNAKAYTQICMSFGAIVATILAALLGNWIGRRLAYVVLCIGSLASALAFFQLNKTFGPFFLFTVFLAGGLTASFYGWLPLYLPELFRTRMRAIGQGFSFNFGRIIAAIGALQTANVMSFFGGDKEAYPQGCSIMSLIYLAGLIIIWFVPETRGKPLPD